MVRKILAVFAGIVAGMTAMFIGVSVSAMMYRPEDPQSLQDPDAFRQPESERLPLELLVKGYTLNGAYQRRMEDDLGSIEVGKISDLVVLGQDLFATD